MVIHVALNLFFPSDPCPSPYIDDPLLGCVFLGPTEFGITRDIVYHFCSVYDGTLFLLSGKEEADALLKLARKFYSFKSLISGLDEKITLVSLVEHKRKKNMPNCK